MYTHLGLVLDAETAYNNTINKNNKDRKPCGRERIRLPDLYYYQIQMSSVKKYIYFLSHKVYEQENIAYLKEKKINTL